jgi:hypothetical protein
MVGLLAAGTAGVSVAQTPEWEALGSRRVRFVGERDAIEVGEREGLFNAIRIDVESGDLEMYDIRVVFADGSDFSPNSRIVFRQGSRSRVIDLPGTARAIRRVSFAYRSRVRRGQATVQVFARRAQLAGPKIPDLAPGAARVLEGWRQLGSRTVAFRTDRDVITVTGDRQARQLQIVVEGGDLEMQNIQITFANGEAHSPLTRLTFQEGARSRVIDLPGEQRVIRRIEFRYRSLLGGRDGRATVNVYGR